MLWRQSGSRSDALLIPNLGGSGLVIATRRLWLAGFWLANAASSSNLDPIPVYSDEHTLLSAVLETYITCAHIGVASNIGLVIISCLSSWLLPVIDWFSLRIQFSVDLFWIIFILKQKHQQEITKLIKTPKGIDIKEKSL